jgi:cytochrome c oxidase assembly protein subunit 15/protoheme IX farnesyltransferase
MEATVPLTSTQHRASRFTGFACFVTGLTLAVILWGAYVRASRSGDGCGAHWPLCNGAAIPGGAEGATAKTAIEYAHRVTSGLDGLFVMAMAVWAFGRFPRGHVVRRCAALSAVFIVTESLIGAGLVLLGLVGENASVLRAVYLSVHLTNTFILIASIALTALWSQWLDPPRARLRQFFHGKPAMALAGALALSVSGAVAALGATLFSPDSPAAEAPRLSAPAQLMFSLKEYMLHPLLAVVVGGYLVYFALGLARRPWARSVVVLTFAQFAAGLVNAALQAPIWLQITHLLLANLLWIALVLLSAAAEPAE